MKASTKNAHVIRTLRIPKALDDDLRKVSDGSKTSVNALAEEALTKFVEYDRFAGDLDYAVVRKPFLSKLMSYLTEEEVKEFGEWAGRAIGAQTIAFYHNRATLQAVVDVYERLGSRYSRIYTFRHETRGTEHTVMINHNMGRKWSLFYEANMKTIFKDLLGIDVSAEVTDNLLIARFYDK